MHCRNQDTPLHLQPGNYTSVPLDFWVRECIVGAKIHRYTFLAHRTTPKTGRNTRFKYWKDAMGGHHYTITPSLAEELHQIKGVMLDSGGQEMHWVETNIPLHLLWPRSYTGLVMDLGLGKSTEGIWIHHDTFFPLCNLAFTLKHSNVKFVDNKQIDIHISFSYCFNESHN